MGSDNVLGLPKQEYCASLIEKRRATNGKSMTSTFHERSAKVQDIQICDLSSYAYGSPSQVITDIPKLRPCLPCQWLGTEVCVTLTLFPRPHGSST
jgi:hypothetical protein